MQHSIAMSQGFGRGRRRVAVNPSRTIQTLRRLKHLPEDDIGNLEYILTSEMSPLVRCNNHSFTVAMRKQLDIWYSDHLTTMRKLSLCQQAEYRNLVRVKNDTRKNYRTGVLRKREEESFDLHMKLERERAEVELKMMELSLEENDGRGVPGGGRGRGRNGMGDNYGRHKERSGWLRIRKPAHRKSDISMPTVLDVSSDDDDSTTALMPIDDQHIYKASTKCIDSSEKSVEELGGQDKGVVKQLDDDARRPDLTDVSRSRPQMNALISEREDRARDNDSHDREQISKLEGRQHVQVSPILRSKRYKAFTIQDSGANFTRPKERRVDEEESLQRKTAEDTERRSQRSRNEDGTGTPGERAEPDPAKFGEEKSGKAWLSNSDPKVTKSTHGRDSREGASPLSKRPGTRLGMMSRASNEVVGVKALEIRQRQGWGVTKTVLRLPEIQFKTVNRVTKYERAEDGTLVASVTALQPSAVKFPLPSKKAQYWRRRALQWNVEQAPLLQGKVQDFLSDCNGRPSSVPGRNRPHSELTFTSTPSRSRQDYSVMTTERMSSSLPPTGTDFSQELRV